MITGTFNITSLSKLPPEYIKNFFNSLVDVELVDLQIHMPRLNLGQIQNIIDEGDQSRTTCLCNFGKLQLLYIKVCVQQKV